MEIFICKMKKNKVSSKMLNAKYVLMVTILMIISLFSVACATLAYIKDV